MTTDRVIQSGILESTTSTGPGTLDLDGAATGWNRFRTFFDDADPVVYVRRNADGSKEQLVRGLISYGTGAGGRDQLTVVNVLKSSDGGASPTAIDWAAGDNPCAVFCASAEDLLDSAIRNHYGTSRPVWLKKGLWVAEGAGATARKLYWFDGTDDIEIATINETANTITLPSGILLAGNPAAALNPAPKQYVDQGDRQGIWGLTYANDVTDATNDIVIAPGGAMDSTGTCWLALASALTKRLDAAWAVGTNQGGILSGSAADVDYNIWLIGRTDLTAVDIGFETTANATPTLPSGYTFYRKVGFFKRVTGVITPFFTYETAGGGIEVEWRTGFNSINTGALTNTRRTDALAVPLTFSTIAHVRWLVVETGASFYFLLCCPDETDGTPGQTVPGAVAFVNTAASGELQVRTSAAGLVASEITFTSGSGSIDTYIVVCKGFTWSRR